MKTLCTAVFALIIFCAIDVKAKAYPNNMRNYSDPIAWKFTVLTDGSPALHSPGTVDYSHELSQTLAVSLPETMIKEGWACVRDEVIHDHDGGFTCKNGQVEISNHVGCANASTEHNEMRIWDIKKSHATPYGVMFVLVSECSR